MPWQAFSIIQTGTSGLSMEREHRAVCYLQEQMTPAYLEKLSKSAAVSKTEAGGGAVDNSMYGNETSAQQAQFKLNQPTQRGPAITVHEWTDELSGGVYFSMKSPSHYWQCQLDNKKLLVVHKSDKKWELQ